jgi:CUB domain
MYNMIFSVNSLFLQAFVKNCGSNLSGSSGTIQSPNYPNPYGNNANCEWTITSPPNTRINITITAFNTEAIFDRLFISIALKYGPTSEGALQRR